MEHDLLIQGGILVDPANGRRGLFDIAVADGVVCAVEEEISPRSARSTYSANGRLVMPGLVDTHVHLTPPRRSIGLAMLARAGVTTALDCSGPVEEVLEGIRRHGSGIAVAVLQRVVPGETVGSADASREEIEILIEKSLDAGALGIKLLGGHVPLTPDATEAAIALANRHRCYAAFHCGSTQNGSNLHGLIDALAFAGEHTVHICHVNAYCRGYTHGSPVEESRIALEALSLRPHILSESHLAPYNSCSARLDHGVPRSHVTRASLQAGGYAPTRDGLLEAVAAGYGMIQRIETDGVSYAGPGDGATILREQGFDAMVSFPVNRRSTAFLMATEKRTDGRFAVTALSTDGGAIPRNFLLSHGLALVRFEALTLDEFVCKCAWNPARMLGLSRKGHLGEGADADLLVVDPETHTPDLVVAGGRVIAERGRVVGAGGTLITTKRGRGIRRSGGIQAMAADLEGGFFALGRAIAPA